MYSNSYIKSMLDLKLCFGLARLPYEYYLRIWFPFANFNGYPRIQAEEQCSFDWYTTKHQIPAQIGQLSYYFSFTVNNMTIT